MDDSDPKNHFRALAHQHHTAAQRLLASGEPTHARYACLELRMALECLAYDLLRLYRDDVPDELLETWQASAVLDALLELDPLVEGPIEFQIEGEAGGIKKPLIAWREERMKVKWAKKAYFQLGHFLHERTFREVERGSLDVPEKIRNRATAIEARIGRVLSSSGWNVRLVNVVQLECDSGGQAGFSISPSQRRSRARCPDCGVNCEVRRDPGDATQFLTRVMASAKSA